ncbi:MAG: hypothetical protein JWN94_2017 [Betaproteobacteria bacterium]|nr:hypothetical protein [Betaproteobacteria bacterium]
MKTARNVVGTIFAVALLALAACASNAQVVDHAFSFDTRYDDQDGEVLDYRYGDSKLPVRAPEASAAAGKPVYQSNVRGPMRRGEFLYVKWRNKVSGQVYEDTVDLRQRLPANMHDYRIHFTVKGPQLSVYLIAPKPRPPDAQSTGPRMYRDLETTRIYPDAMKQ